jgi:hypothetical protein
MSNSSLTVLCRLGCCANSAGAYYSFVSVSELDFVGRCFSQHRKIGGFPTDQVLVTRAVIFPIIGLKREFGFLSDGKSLIAACFVFHNNNELGIKLHTSLSQTVNFSGLYLSGVQRRGRCSP